MIAILSTSNPCQQRKLNSLLLKNTCEYIHAEIIVAGRMDNICEKYNVFGVYALGIKKAPFRARVTLYSCHP